MQNIYSSNGLNLFLPLIETLLRKLLLTMTFLCVDDPLI